MTGYGEATARWRGGFIRTEIRSVNHKFFNLKLNLPEILRDYESEIEQEIRRYIHRGMVNCNIKLDKSTQAKLFQFNNPVLKHYYRQLCKFQRQWHIKDGPRLETLLNLPGVIEPVGLKTNTIPQLKHQVSQVIKAALKDLVAMRRREAQRLKRSLTHGLRKIAELVSRIKKRAPLVLTRHQQHLQSRLNQALKKHSTNLSKHPSLMTELVLIAQRCAITEEVDRLSSHLAEFRNSFNHRAGIGKRLDFITQELLRETNTIGAKANDARIAHWSIDLKNEIEKIKEQVQNIE